MASYGLRAGVPAAHLRPHRACRPKDAKAGLASGAKSIGKGFLAGLVTLVAAPTAGALQEGSLGFGKGLAYGAPLAAPAACIHINICEASIELGRKHESSAASEAGDSQQGTGLPPPPIITSVVTCGATIESQAIHKLQQHHRTWRASVSSDSCIYI